MRLKNWYIQKIMDKKEEGQDPQYVYRASGILMDQHPRLDVGMDIHTSKIETLKWDEDKCKLDAFTHSKSHYELYLNDAAGCYESNFVDMLNAFKLDGDSINKKIETAKKEYLQRESERLKTIIADGELYIDLAGDTCVNAFYRKGEDIVETRVGYHIGTFQDSVIVAYKNLVDFRFWPMYDCIEIYHWSNGLKAVHINNIGANSVEVKGAKRTKCESGQVTKILPDSAQEGLISPDGVDGKSILKE